MVGRADLHRSFADHVIVKGFAPESKAVFRLQPETPTQFCASAAHVLLDLWGMFQDQRFMATRTKDPTCPPQTMPGNGGMSTHPKVDAAGI